MNLLWFHFDYYLRQCGISIGSQNIFRLQITVYNIFKMKISQRIKDLKQRLSVRWTLISTKSTCVIRNFVIRSSKRPCSELKIISNISPCNFSMTTNICCGFSNMLYSFTIPGWSKPWKYYENGFLSGEPWWFHHVGRTDRIWTSWISWVDSLFGNLVLSTTFIATSLCFVRCRAP